MIPSTVDHKWMYSGQIPTPGKNTLIAPSNFNKTTNTLKAENKLHISSIRKSTSFARKKFIWKF